jgi:hypothetical protein
LLALPGGDVVRIGGKSLQDLEAKIFQELEAG